MLSTLYYFCARTKLNKEAPSVSNWKVIPDNIQGIIKPTTWSTRWHQAHLRIDLRRNPRSWFKLYFSCFKYKYTYMKNVIYPGPDIKLEACAEVISCQHDKDLHRQCDWSECVETYKDVGSIGENYTRKQTNFNAVMKERERGRWYTPALSNYITNNIHTQNTPRGRPSLLLIWLDCFASLSYKMALIRATEREPIPRGAGALAGQLERFLKTIDEIAKPPWRMGTFSSRAVHSTVIV